MGSLFISNPFERGLNRDGRLFERRGWGRGGGLFNLGKIIVSVLHKGLEYKVEKVRYKKLESCSRGSVNHPGSVHTKFYSRD